jgi:hypothetical protein
MPRRGFFALDPPRSAVACHPGRKDLVRASGHSLSLAAPLILRGRQKLTDLSWLLTA